MNELERLGFRNLNKQIGLLPTGEKNCITDVDGVKVGHVTLHYPVNCPDEFICTGVTAILPHGENIFKNKVVATSHVLNGFGKSTGLIQVNELGLLESPIMLTNTFGVPAVTEGTLQYLLAQNEEIGETTGTINIVVGECNDSYLNSIRLLPIKPKHAIEAIEKATSDKVMQGAIGAGTGMVCFDYKGGIGTSSRIIEVEGMEKKFMIGALVLSNFGIEDELLHYNKHTNEKKLSKLQNDINKDNDGSIMIVLATDLPLSDRQLNRIAKRAGIGLGRTGSHMGHGSGDIVIAFSTAKTFSHQTEDNFEEMTIIREDKEILNEAFKAAADTTEEAIMNSLTYAKTTKGRKNRTVKEVPYELFEDLS